jgi:hypothetical protein
MLGLQTRHRLRIGRGDGGGPRPEPPGSSPDFFAFDLASVETYLVADRVLKAAPPGLRWVPAAPIAHDRALMLDENDAAAKQRASELGLPVCLPPPELGGVPRAMRAADYAAANGFGGELMQICSRLRFAAGFDIDGEILNTLNVGKVPRSFMKDLVEAADDELRDALLRTSSAWLVEEGVRHLPALRLDRKIACGQAAIIQLLERKR